MGRSKSVHHVSQRVALRVAAMLLLQLVRGLACTGLDSYAQWVTGQQAAGFHSFTLQKLGYFEAAAAVVIGGSTYVRMSEAML